MNEFPQVRSIQEVYEEVKSKHKENIVTPLLLDLCNLDTSERNRVYSLISRTNGKLRADYIKDMQRFLAANPINITHRRKPPEEIGAEKTYVDRSRFLDQHYLHQLPGINDQAGNDLQKFLKLQKQLAESCRSASTMLNQATKKLVEAYPDVPRDGLNLGPEIPLDDIPKDYSAKLPKCPARYMESSIAIVMEHIDHMSMDLTQYSTGRPAPQCVLNGT